jgi:hypothetical protein
MDKYNHQEKIVMHLLDMASAGTIIATLADILPAISAFLACVWMLIRIFETSTIKTSLKELFSGDIDDDNNDDNSKDNFLK